MPAAEFLADCGDPLAVFTQWYEAAGQAGLKEPTAMTLATATAGGRPSARTVLLKAHDPRGFLFFTNSLSRKGGELAENPQAALLFYWMTLGRQVRVEGRVEVVSAAEADAYFASRRRMSRIGSWASEQSRPMPSRKAFEERIEAFDRRYPGEDIPRPPYWNGYRLIPDYFEFWEELEFRLHTRRMYRREATGWQSGLLYP